MFATYLVVLASELRFIGCSMKCYEVMCKRSDTKLVFNIYI